MPKIHEIKKKLAQIEIGAVQERVNLADLENAAKRLSTCKHRLRSSRERALQKFAKSGKFGQVGPTSAATGRRGPRPLRAAAAVATLPPGPREENFIKEKFGDFGTPCGTS